MLSFVGMYYVPVFMWISICNNVHVSTFPPVTNVEGPAMYALLRSVGYQACQALPRALCGRGTGEVQHGSLHTQARFVGRTPHLVVKGVV